MSRYWIANISTWRNPPSWPTYCAGSPACTWIPVGGRGGTGSLYLRGADPNYTLVLVDGVRVNDPTNARGGSFDFSTFDVADVERVEIARGPYSAVYGGDALAGVINIITRRAVFEQKKAHASLDAMGGAYDTREIALSAGGPVG